MSMTMRERIAAAMAGEPWDKLSDTIRETYLRQTDLALAELETPTDQMVEVVINSVFWPINDVTRDVVRGAWYAAIRAARDGK